MIKQMGVNMVSGCLFPCDDGQPCGLGDALGGVGGVFIGDKLVGLACCANQPDLVVFLQDADEVLRGGGGFGVPVQVGV